MKYFAKELSVECPQLAKQIEGSSCNKNNNCIYPKCTKKLFLCSRDIRIGDKLTWLFEGLSDYDCPGIITDEEDIVIAKEKSKWCFKVIGEISPDAIWVREGDEFDEYEEWWFAPQTNSFIWKHRDGDEKNYSLLLQAEIRIRIKCSQCNTFH